MRGTYIDRYDSSTRPSRARLCAPTNASPSRPDPPTLIRRRLVDSDHRRPRQAALQRRKTAEKRLKETGKALLPREAAHRRQQGRSTRRSEPARPILGRAGAVSLTRPACDQLAPSQMRVGERGAGGLGADWAAGATGSRAECATGRPLRAGEGKRGRASGRRRAARRPVSAGCAPKPSSSAWEQLMPPGACWRRAGGGVGDRGRAPVAAGAAGAVQTARDVCVRTLAIRRARKSGRRRPAPARGAPSPASPSDRPNIPV